MDVLDAIYGRRAVRSFTSEKVEAGVIHKLIHAAIQAPSARNAQPWAFCVIQNPDFLKDLSEKIKIFVKNAALGKPQAEPFVDNFSDPKFDVFFGATTLIVICAKKEGFGPIEDCYLAGENLMLAATKQSLGTCPIGFARDILKTEEFRKKLSLPADYVPALAIAIGYAAGREMRPTKKPPVIFKWI